MAKDKDKIILLLVEKLKLLEFFVSNMTQLARKYNWKVSKQDQATMQMISSKLDTITKDIANALKE